MNLPISEISQEEAIQQFLKISSMSNSTASTIDSIMSAIGEHYDADRVYLFERHISGKYISIISEWCREGVESKKERYKQVPVHELKSWKYRFENFGCLYLSADENLSIFDPDAYAFLTRLGIDTLITTPIYRKSVFSGFFSVENPRRHKSHLLLMSIVANILDNEVQHLHILEKEANEKKILQQANEQLVSERDNLSTQFSHVESMSRDVEDFFVVDVNQRTSTIIMVGTKTLSKDKQRILSYDETWNNYIEKFVVPDDRGKVRNQVVLENVCKVLSEQREYSFRYRVFIANEIKFLRVTFAELQGSNGDKIGMGFRCIDDIVRTEQEQKAILRKSYELAETRLKEIEALNEKIQENLDIIVNAGFGTWRIQMNDNGANSMIADKKLQQILGIENMNLSPEELYVFYHGRLQEDVNTIENHDYRSMQEGRLMSRNLTWNHPTKGIIFMTAGGRSHIRPNGELILSGYCADVTEQKSKEDRTNLIIESLAKSYEFLNYISVDEGTFYTSSMNLFLSSGATKLAERGDYGEVRNYSLKFLVSPEYIADMTKFTDLSTINQRMGHLRMLINQFKDYKGIWHEWTFVVADRKKDGSINHLIWTLRQIEDEKQAELRKQQIIDDNIAANKAKTMFLQNMSHEIRTPLNAMFGFSQLLGLPDGTWTEEEKDQYNTYIYNSYNMLDMLIGDILDIADSEHGNYRISITDVPVNMMCRNAMMSVEYRKLACVNMYYTTEVDDNHMIKSDGRRIQQVLINFLTNACKNTESGEIHVHCSTTLHPGKIAFSVTDTGRGIPPEKAEMIFARFAKLDKFSQGSGLGLNICQMIADKLGGEVYLDKSYTTGARFVFVLEDK